MIDHETQVAEIAAFARCGLDEAETAARQFGAEKCLWFAKLEGRLPLDGLDMLAASRKAWRALIRIDALDEHYVHVVIPSWEPRSVVRLLGSSVPQLIMQRISSGVERLHAWVNIGAENSEDLYFRDWETR